MASLIRSLSLWNPSYTRRRAQFMHLVMSPTMLNEGFLIKKSFKNFLVKFLGLNFVGGGGTGGGRKRTVPAKRVPFLAWHPKRLELLSSGANQTVVRWSYSDSVTLFHFLYVPKIIFFWNLQDSIWLPISRFGDIVGDEVNCYDITYSPCGRYALCHSFLGGFHFWQIDSKVREMGKCWQKNAISNLIFFVLG